MRTIAYKGVNKQTKKTNERRKTKPRIYIKNIIETENYFIKKIHQNELMCKKKKRFIA